MIARLISPFLLAVAASCLTGTVTLAASAEKTEAIDPIYSELAGLIVTDSTLGAEVDKIASSLIENMNATDPDFADMESRYPGLGAAVAASMKPLLLEGATRTLPLYRADLAQFYARQLTAAEARTFVDFMARPSTRLFYEEVRRQNSYKAITGDLVKDRDASTASMSKDLKNAAPKAVAALNPAQQLELQAFFTSPLGKKLQSLNPEKTKIDAKWFNYSAPDLEDRMEKVVIDGMIAHIEKTDQATADLLRKELAKERR